MINLRKTLETAKQLLLSAKIDYALIGGFAMGAHGLHRATKDIDLLVDGEKKDQVKNLFLGAGFEIAFESKEVLQLRGPGYVDIVYANRPLSLKMIKTAPHHHLFGVPVVSPEGIIGLKIQAYSNDPTRKLQDLADIQALLRIPNIDLTQVKIYADLFNAWPEIESLRQ